MVRFNFGKNWLAYSRKALDEEKFVAAEKSLIDLIGKKKIKNHSFLDIGSGSGIFSLAAKKIGASRVLGIDISEESVVAARKNQKNILPSEKNVKFLKKSILGKEIKKLGKFDIVYSWGALHHTGKMWRAIKISMGLTKKNGLLVIAIYNKHWSSPFWRAIKHFYNLSPKFIRFLMIKFFYLIIALAKLITTRKNPFAKKRRGMSFYYDVIDWLGGYPYEYVGKEEIENFCRGEKFKLKKFVKTPVPTGCNEFVFRKISD